MKFVNLNELDARIKKMNRPKPQDVVNLILEMRGEM